MDNLPKQIAAEVENVGFALRNLEETMGRQVKTVVELAAMGTFLHNIYNGIENILKQSLKLNKIQMARGENWHKELLTLSVTNGIISEGLSDELYEYLTFRHYFVHAYGFMLEEAPLEPLAQNIPGIWSKFISEVAQSFGVNL
ncbi:MAG: hypothetical protein A2X82_01230 [Geobacteraceae bacterium GWC2_55_20]|nr:MAG: hypothetical protein A2X82_01230 [Geobacteraceae bacterium GWC2_55_20]OGU25710.1 MAG: hypothetical protein A2X85_14185 [Geobacteraceae bacterium GWF2_54_21]HCE68589.1 hypothetical protein [Geobacter sp.]